MARAWKAAKAEVKNRGKAPDAFLDALVDWAIGAPGDIFSRNDNDDIYGSVAGTLGPWRDDMHRRAAMLEVLRVLGGFESSWKWDAGVDTTNPKSNKPCTMEAGLFQCSGDSMSFDASLKTLLKDATGKTDCDTFRAETKRNHPFAIEYCARLLRFTTDHHGPVKGKRIHEWLRKDAVDEFEAFLRGPTP